LGVIAASVVALGAMVSPAGAAGKVNIRHQKIVNISDQSFGVAFTTSAKVGRVSMLFGATCKTATTKVAQVKGSNGLAHLINAPGGLKASTTYAYKLVVDGVVYNEKHCLAATTYASTTIPPPPATIYGASVTSKTCDNAKAKVKASPGSLIYADVVHGKFTSDILATIADSKAHWALPFGDVTFPNGQFVKPANGDTIQYQSTINQNLADDDQITYDGSSQLIGPESLCVQTKK
jgi:hypothetical protein